MSQVTRDSPDSVADAAGNATVTLTNPGPYTFDVQQVSPSASSAPLGSTGKIYKGGAFICDFIPQSDAVVGPPNVQLYPGESCSARWTGLSVGSTCKATFIFDDGQPA